MRISDRELWLIREALRAFKTGERVLAADREALIERISTRLLAHAQGLPEPDHKEDRR